MIVEDGEENHVMKMREGSSDSKLLKKQISEQHCRGKELWVLFR